MAEKKKIFGWKRDIVPALAMLHGIIFCIWLMIILGVSLSFFSVDMPGMGRTLLSPDFIAYHTAAKLALVRSQDIYNVDAFKAIQEMVFSNIENYKNTYLIAPLPFLNPPNSLLLLLPVGLLSFPTAYAVWISISILLSVPFVFAVLSYFQVQGIGLRWLFGLLLVGNYFWGGAIGQGQFAVILGMALIFLLLAWKKNRPWQSAFCLAVLAIKPHLFFLLALPVVFSLPRRFALTAFLVVTASFLLTMMFFSWGVFEDYFKAIFKVNQVVSGYQAGFGDMYNLRNLLYGFLHVSFEQSSHIALIAFAGVVIMLTGLWAWLRPVYGTTLFDTLCGLTLTANIFFTPWVHTHDMLVLAIPLGMLLRHYDWQRKGACIFIALLYLLYINFLWQDGWFFMQILLIYAFVARLVRERAGIVEDPV